MSQSIIEVMPQSARDANGMQVTLWYIGVDGLEPFDPIGIWMEEDGMMRQGKLTDLVFDFRYDRGEGKWVDTGPGAAAVELREEDSTD